MEGVDKFLKIFGKIFSLKAVIDIKNIKTAENTIYFKI